MTRRLSLSAVLVAAIIGCGCDSNTTAPTRLLNVADFSPAAASPRNPAPAPPMFVYMGTVRNVLGQPVAGAIVEIGAGSCVTDGNGRYQFRGPSQTAIGRVRPPDGYQPAPKQPFESFPISAGGQDLTIS